MARILQDYHQDPNLNYSDQTDANSDMVILLKETIV